MRRLPSAWIKPVWSVICKDAVNEFRTRYACGALSMFALVTLSSISMSVGGAVLSPILQAALLWVVLFFSAMAGLSRVFAQEQETGTIFTLRVYARPQAVLFGKACFNVILLLGLSLFITPLFMLFFNVQVAAWLVFAGVLVLGAVGLAAVSTLTAAMVAHTQGKGPLFTVLTFPVLLPLFLTAIQTTAKVFAGGLPATSQMLFLAGYDVCVIIAASLLFDYLWSD